MVFRGRGLAFIGVGEEGVVGTVLGLSLGGDSRY